MLERLTCRLATLRDAAPLADAASSLFVAAFGADNTPEDMQSYTASAFGPDIQSRQILDPFQDTLLLHRDDDFLGYAQIDYGPAPASLSLTRPGGIRRFYLESRAHGSGAASVLFDAVTFAAQQRGARCLWLGVWEHNARAIAYYRKAGFDVRADTSFLLGKDLQRDLLMVREGGR
ncbi:MAG: GNAT family N-acetyltransferase [Gammaproteobacteria bacterium]